LADASSAPTLQLSDAEIDRLRRSGITLRADGRFFHEGEEVLHEGLRAALWRWLDRQGDGRYVLRLDAERFVFLTVEDAPHVVRSLRVLGATGEPQRRTDREAEIMLGLADGSEEKLDPATLRLSPEGIAYCRVKAGRFDARFAPSAFSALGEFFVEREGHTWLELGDARVRLG
jgi:hypothetical protein